MEVVYLQGIANFVKKKIKKRRKKSGKKFGGKEKRCTFAIPFGK